MDFEERKPKDPNYSVKSASVLSQLFFCWTLPLLKKGASAAHILNTDDLQSVVEAERSDVVGDSLESAWAAECRNAAKAGQGPRFFRALSSIFGFKYMLLASLMTVDELVLRVLQTLCLKWLVESFTNGSPVESRYLYAGFVCLTALLHGLVIHPTYFGCSRIGMKCRVGASSLLYRKCLKLRLGTVNDSTVGQAVNLLSNDLARFDWNLYNIPYLIIGPVQFTILTWMLWEELEVSTMAGIGFLVLFLPLQYFVGSSSRKYRSGLAKQTDSRASLLNQVIEAIRVIKMYAWEKPFSAKIQQLRADETSTLWKSKKVRAISAAFNHPVPKITTCLSLVTFYLSGSVLTSSKVFFVVSVFNVLRQTIGVYIPQAAAEIGELIAVMKRVETFLVLDEKEEVQESNSTVEPEDGCHRRDPEIGLADATARWNPDTPCLENINLKLKGNQLLIVIGGVGSGKSTLLHTLMKELPLTEGTCETQGKISYASQVPWIFSGTIKQNILLGLPFEEEKFRKILYACGLEEDCKQFPDGILTQVGDRGNSLSGGQKARVSFARSLYQSGQIMLFDDILSALDPRVGRHVFREAILEYLGSSLRVLATHQVQFLPFADHILLLERGMVRFQGTYAEFLTSGIELTNMKEEVGMEDEKDSLSLRMDPDPQPVNLHDAIKLDSKSILESNRKRTRKYKEDTENVQEPQVVGSIYWEYYRSGNSKVALFFFFNLFIFSQLLYALVEVWLADWTVSVERGHLQLLQPQNQSGTNFQYTLTDYEDMSTVLPRDVYLWGYIGLTTGIILLTLVRTIWFYRASLNVSQGIHDKMFSSLMRAPTEFFDKNPSGRIMNRFTKDLGTIDELLPDALYNTVSNFFMFLGILIVVVASNYWLAIPAFLFVVSLWALRKFYLKSSRELKRIEATEKSPVYTHLSGSFHGLATIRVSRCEAILTHQFDGLQDNHSAAWFAYISTSRWFGLWLEITSVLFLTLVTILLLSISSGSEGGAWVGLAISSMLGLTISFQYGMRQSAEADNMMISVERALEYAQLTPEAPLESPPEYRPSEEWPFHGTIEFKNVSLAYGDSAERVLNNLSFEVLSGERIGIVGRTGAGKSSMAAALFRMTEPSGFILIDGIDITTLGLHDLRPRISIIPQDPQLFSGTIRYNLDPFSEFSDLDIWRALRAVELTDKVSTLDNIVVEGGGNFSVGERQLLCLGRTMLRKNKILILDEMTANIDTRTETLIQKTIEENFQGCTVLTIAHRLSTIMNCDRILVLSHGRLVEFDSPNTLLANPTSAFKAMVPPPNQDHGLLP